MGAFIIFDIGFETAKDREKFEKKYKLKDKDILVGDKSGSGGFSAWTMMRNPCLDVVYFMGFMGYAEPELILKECLTGKKLCYNEEATKEYWTKQKKKDMIKINFLAWIPINDKDSVWEKERGRWEERTSHQKCSECLWQNKNKKCNDKYCLVNELMKENKVGKNQNEQI